MADEAGSNGDAAAPPVGKEAVERLIREHGQLFTAAQCKVCSALLISESQKLAHYQSKKHANKVRRYMAIHGEAELAHGKKMKLESKQESSNSEDRNKCCAICNMTFSSPVVAMSHYLGKTHAKNLKLKQQAPKAEVAAPSQKCPAQLPPATVPSNEETKCTADPDKFCSLCHATFNNPLMAKQHYTGKKHRKQETKLKLMAHYGRTPDAPAATSAAGKGYPCSTCNIVLNSIEQYQAHISGFKHKNQADARISAGRGPVPKAAVRPGRVDWPRGLQLLQPRLLELAAALPWAQLVLQEQTSLANPRFPCPQGGQDLASRTSTARALGEGLAGADSRQPNSALSLSSHH